MLLLSTSVVHADDACHAASGVAIRVKFPDNKLTRLSWEGASSDCAYSGDDLAKLKTDDNTIKLVIPDTEFSDLTTGQLTIDAVAEQGDKKQSIDVTLIKTKPPVSPKLYFYFGDLPNTEASIDAMRQLEQSQKIYQNYYAARKLALEGANTNIVATATYFYYQSAILIEPSTEFSRGSMKVSEEARTLMRNLLTTLADPDAPNHDAVQQAVLKNYHWLIRPIKDLRNELGMPPLTGGVTN
jgi:hypothetical protein